MAYQAHDDAKIEYISYSHVHRDNKLKWKNVRGLHDAALLDMVQAAEVEALEVSTGTPSPKQARTKNQMSK